MDKIQVKDKQFKISIHEKEILDAVQKIANRINTELSDKQPLFLGVLNGSFMFMSDLMKRINIPAEISFVKMSSYEGMSTTGKIKKLIGLNQDIKGRTIVVVEDIVDTGFTMMNMIAQLKELGAGDIKIATLVSKPEARKHEVPLDYIAFEIPNRFIVGYGLDYDGFGRNLPHIYTLCD
ncbi:MAG: hypoxanthine phosphoribosyltransferase [Bacteroidales bacterium]|nr:hypoxanthine phosphoribosyltransferase [Bacteroidales bacterium]